VILANNRLSPEAAYAMINTHQFQPPARWGPACESVPVCGSANRWTSPGAMAGNPTAICCAP
jgi:hypothetical protein